MNRTLIASAVQRVYACSCGHHGTGADFVVQRPNGSRICRTCSQHSQSITEAYTAPAGPLYAPVRSRFVVGTQPDSIGSEVHSQNVPRTFDCRERPSGGVSVKARVATEMTEGPRSGNRHFRLALTDTPTDGSQPERLSARPVGREASQREVVGYSRVPKSVQPPVGNTGGKVARQPDTSASAKPHPAGSGGVRIDWLNVTFPIEHLDAITRTLETAEGTFTPRTGLHSYENGSASASGVVLCWTQGRREALLSMPGDSMLFHEQSLDRTMQLLHILHSIGGKSSRIDLAYDDTEGLIDIAQVEKAVDRGHFDKFRHTSIVRSTDGHTVYLGKRGANGGTRSVCLYNKAKEQKHEGIHWSRLEVRFQKVGAHVVFCDLVRRIAQGDAPHVVLETIARWISGSVDFVKRSSIRDSDGNLVRVDNDRHKDRMTRLTWWQKVVDKLGEPQLLSLPKRVQHIEKFVAFFTQNMAPSLSVVRDLVTAYGDDFAQVLSYVLDSAATRVKWSADDERMLGVDRQRLIAAFDRHLTPEGSVT